MMLIPRLFGLLAATGDSRGAFSWQALLPSLPRCESAQTRGTRRRPIRQATGSPRQAPFRGSARFPEVPHSSQHRWWRSCSRTLTLTAVPGSPASTVGYIGVTRNRFPRQAGRTEAGQNREAATRGVRCDVTLPGKYSDPHG